MSLDARKAELIENLRRVRDQIPDSRVTLVAVSKLKPASDIQALYDAGHRHFGENYVQELMDKAAQLPSDIQWHFIGGLQSNKCKQLASGVPNLFAVETLDTQKKANELNKGRSGTPLQVLMQVNTSGEAEKSGVAPSDAGELARHIMQECKALQLAGLMTIGNIATSRQHGENADFKALKQVKADLEASLNIPLLLSMGMSEDYEDAVRMGSNQVRIGSGIFGARPAKESQAAEDKVAAGQA